MTDLSAQSPRQDSIPDLRQLTLGKLIIGVISGSLALIADALQGLVDILVTMVALVVVTISARGPDPAWTCGREKLEAQAALIEAAQQALVAAIERNLSAALGPVDVLVGFEPA